MQACLHGNCLQNVMVVKKKCFIKTKIESNSQIIYLSNINLLF
jgi:hypothetical protein